MYCYVAGQMIICTITYIIMDTLCDIMGFGVSVKRSRNRPDRFIDRRVKFRNIRGSTGIDFFGNKGQLTDFSDIIAVRISGKADPERGSRCPEPEHLRIVIQKRVHS